jgi:hypothetical protein
MEINFERTILVQFLTRSKLARQNRDQRCNWIFKYFILYFIILGIIFIFIKEFLFEPHKIKEFFYC